MRAFREEIMYNRLNLIRHFERMETIVITSFTISIFPVQKSPTGFYRS